jgi:hypothetical protein
MQLNPLEEFVIARGLEDHSDNTTYYVRATVRNAKTDALLATVDLTDQGDSHRFTKRYFVPADPTGMGYYLLITTSVYTDSGYTTKADNYGDKYETYLVYQRMNPVIDGGGGGVSSEKIREIVSAELKKLEFPQPPRAQDVDLSPLTEAIERLSKQISAIEIPEAEKISLQPVLEAVAGLKKTIEDIEMPETDFSGIEYRLDRHEEALTQADLSAVTEKVESLFSRIKEFLGHDIDQFNSEVKSIREHLDGIAYVTLQGGKKPTNPEQE